MLTVIVRYSPALTASGNPIVAVERSSSVTVTVAEKRDPMRYVAGPLATRNNVAVTVPAPWATLSSVVVNVSSTLPVDAGIVTLVGRLPVVRRGPVSVTLAISVSGSVGAGSAVTRNCTGLPSTTDSVTAVMVTELACGRIVVPGPVRESPSVDDSVTVTEAEPAGPTVYPSPSVTDAVIVPPGPVASPRPARQRGRRRVQGGTHDRSEPGAGACRVTFKPEANELELGETAVRAFGVLLDLQHADGQAAAEPLRVMPHIRYLNAFEGRRAERWQYKNEREPLVDIGTRGKTWSHFHFKSNNWVDIPGGGQRLCYNEIATKHNWYYLRRDFDQPGTHSPRSGGVAIPR